MFRLHDRTRRRLLLVAFGLLCVVPTLLVAGWCAWRNRPWRAAAEAGRLASLLGFHVTLEKFEHLRPGVVRYRGLELADTETAESVLHCPVLVVSQDQDGARPILKLEAETARLEARALPRLQPLFAGLLRGQSGQRAADVQLAVGRVTLDADGRTFDLAAVDADLATLTGGSQLRAALRVDGSETPEPVQIRVGRNRQTLPPSSGFELDTGGGPIPCRLLGAALQRFAPLPQSSTFCGRLWAQQTETGWQGQATGYLLDVDLAQLLDGRLPQRLTGRAQLTLQSARFQDGRLVEASGVVTAGPGKIGRRLIEAAARELAMQSAPLAETTDAVPYEQLAMAFLLNPDGLQLYGRIPTARGVVLAGQDRWLLGEAPSTAQPRPIPALVRTLSARSGLSVPATPEAEWLTRCLPLPKPVAQPAATSVYLREAQSAAPAAPRY